MAEEQRVAGGDAIRDLRLPHLPVELVGNEHHHDVAAACGVGHVEHLEAVLERLRDRARLGRSPTTTFTPESLRFSACACPCEP